MRTAAVSRWEEQRFYNGIGRVMSLLIIRTSFALVVNRDCGGGGGGVGLCCSSASASASLASSVGRRRWSVVGPYLSAHLFRSSSERDHRPMRPSSSSTAVSLLYSLCWKINSDGGGGGLDRRWVRLEPGPPPLGRIPSHRCDAVSWAPVASNNRRGPHRRRWWPRLRRRRRRRR